MKPIVASLVVSLALSHAAFSQSMQIHTSSGVTEIQLSDIDSITFSLGPTASDSDITSNLALWLPLNGNTLDSSGNGNNGTSSGAAFTTDKWGNTGNAYQFNGTDNFIIVPNSASLNPTNQLTVCFWLRVDQIMGNYMPIVVKAGTVTDGFPNREYGVWTKQNLTAWYPEFESAGDSSTQHELISDNRSFTVGQWNFFAFVCDRNQHKIRMYADGILTSEVDDSYSTFNENTNDLVLGWSNEGLLGHAPLNGGLDNVRIYTRALTPGQVQFLYTMHQ